MKYIGISKRYLCPCCRRTFLVPYQSRGGGRTEWVYRMRIKNKRVYLCSYRCFQELSDMEPIERAVRLKMGEVHYGI